MMLMCFIKGSCLITQDVLCNRGKQQFRKPMNNFTSDEFSSEEGELEFFNLYKRIEQLKFFSEIPRDITPSNKKQKAIYRYFAHWAVVIYNSDFVVEKYGKPSRDIIRKTSQIEGIGHYFRIELTKYTIKAKLKYLVKNLIFWDKLKLLVK